MHIVSYSGYMYIRQNPPSRKLGGSETIYTLFSEWYWAVFGCGMIKFCSMMVAYNNFIHMGTDVQMVHMDQYIIN